MDTYKTELLPAKIARTKSDRLHKKRARISESPTNWNYFSREICRPEWTVVCVALVPNLILSVREIYCIVDENEIIHFPYPYSTFEWKLHFHSNFKVNKFIEKSFAEKVNAIYGYPREIFNWYIFLSIINEQKFLQYFTLQSIPATFFIGHIRQSTYPRRVAALVVV